MGDIGFSVTEKKFHPGASIQKSELATEFRGSAQDRFSQRVQAGFLRSRAETFDALSCTADFAVTIACRRATVAGVVTVYGGEGTLLVVRRAVREVEELAAKFAEAWPESSVTLRFVQRLAERTPDSVDALASRTCAHHPV